MHFRNTRAGRATIAAVRRSVSMRFLVWHSADTNLPRSANVSLTPLDRTINGRSLKPHRSIPDAHQSASALVLTSRKRQLLLTTKNPGTHSGGNPSRRAAFSPTRSGAASGGRTSSGPCLSITRISVVGRRGDCFFSIGEFMIIVYRSSALAGAASDPVLDGLGSIGSAPAVPRKCRFPIVRSARAVSELRPKRTFAPAQRADTEQYAAEQCDGADNPYTR